MRKEFTMVLMALCATSTKAEAPGPDDPAMLAAEMMPLASKSLVLDVIDVAQRFWAVGERGHILKSNDGSTWEQVAGPTRADLTAIYARGSRIWAVGHGQTIVGSIDGGLTFNRQNVDVSADGPLLDVYFSTEDAGIAIGAYGQYCTTSDAGQAWDCGFISDHNVSDKRVKEVSTSEDDEDGLYADTDIGDETGDPHLNDITETPAGSLVIVGEKGNVYRSTDKGESWERRAMGYRGSMFGVFALDDGVIIAHGLRGHAFQSVDDGMTWAELNTGTDQSLIGGAPLTGGRAVLVGGNGTVLLKRQGANDLAAFPFPAGGLLATVAPITDTTFAVGGENGLAVFQPGK